MLYTDRKNLEEELCLTDVHFLWVLGDNTVMYVDVCMYRCMRMGCADVARISKRMAN